MVDETGSSGFAARMSFNAALAALRSYRAVYGDPLGRDSELIMDDLRWFWLHQFRSGRPFPFRVSPTQDEQAPASREAEPAPPRASEEVEDDGSGWVGGREGPIRGELERLKRDFD